MNKVHKPLYFYLMLFFSTTIIGALLLYLPFTGKKPISFLDALFIASSAFTVTGLSPVDIGSQFNILGEIVILLLIQIGGLGIVTVTLLTLVFLNRKISMKNRFLIIGHFVVIDFINCKKLSKLSLHSKLVLTTTSILIIIGAITFFLLEQFNTMQNMGLVEKIGNSFFQSITTRTAGFNSIDIASINKSTALMLMLLMFIGGAPLSAAGGIKITTFAVAFIFVLNYIRKENNVSVFNKEISDKYIKLSIVTINISFLFISIITFILSIINPNISLIKLLFEVVSAFGTVGLSMNLTTEYHGITKIIIIFVMLCGKVGLLTLLRTFIPPKSPKNYRYTKGQIYL